MIQPLGNISEETKHTADVVAGTSFLASVGAWLIAHTALVSSITAVLVGFYTILRMIESGQRIYFNWRYGPHGRGE